MHEDEGSLVAAQGESGLPYADCQGIGTGKSGRQHAHWLARQEADFHQPQHELFLTFIGRRAQAEHGARLLSLESVKRHARKGRSAARCR